MGQIDLFIYSYSMRPFANTKTKNKHFKEWHKNIDMNVQLMLFSTFVAKDNP